MEMVPWKEIKKNQEWNFMNTKDSMQNEKNIVLRLKNLNKGSWAIQRQDWHYDNTEVCNWSYQHVSQSFFSFANILIDLPSILSGADSEGFGGPLLRSFRTGDRTRFAVKSTSRSNNQKQSEDKIGVISLVNQVKKSLKFLSITCNILHESTSSKTSMSICKQGE